MMLEASGLTPQLRELASNDQSAYVRSEIVDWLLRKHDLSAVADVIRQTAARLSSQESEALVSLATSAPQLAVPPVLSELRLGRGLPRYLSLLAKESAAVASALISAFQEGSESSSSMKLILGVLADTRSQDFVQTLGKRIESEQNVGTRILIAQYIASSMSQTNAAARSVLEAKIPTAQPGLHPVELLYREQRIELGRGLEVEIASALGEANPDYARIDVILSRYLRNGQLLGLEYVSADTLDRFCKFAADSGVAFSDGLVAQAAYVRAQMGAQDSH